MSKTHYSRHGSVTACGREIVRNGLPWTKDRFDLVDCKKCLGTLAFIRDSMK